MMEILLIVLVLSLDAFVASVAYGTNRIRIPFTSIIIINVVCTSFLTFSLFFGSLFRKVFPQNTATIISFIILFTLGVYYLFESLIKRYLENKSKQKIKLKLFNIWFIVDIYIDETKADLDDSKSLSSKEALYLAIALSLDSLAVGFGSALCHVDFPLVVFLSLFFGIFAIWVGLLIGEKFNEKLKLNLSWLTGVILIVLAVLKLV